MSTDYKPSEKIRLSDLVDGRLERFGVREKMHKETSDRKKCLTDERNFLWIYTNDEGFVGCLTRYGLANAPGKILGAIAEAFDTDIFSEYEPQYWGFKTQEEWDAAWAAIAKEHDDQFYGEILNFVAGEHNGIEPGTVGETQALIVKRSVGEDPTLTSPERQAELMEKIETVYSRDHAVVVTLSDRDMALARMLATHEDDLPQA